MHTIGELDHQGAHVTAHGHHKLADGFGLGRVSHFELAQLGDAVNQTCHSIAELGTALIQCVVRVLHSVMQQTGRHHDRTHAQIGKNLGNGQRMDDVRLAGLAALNGMLDNGTLIGAIEDGQILSRVMSLAHLLDWFKRIERISADLASQLAGGILLAIDLRHASHLPHMTLIVAVYRG